MIVKWQLQIWQQGYFSECEWMYFDGGDSLDSGFGILFFEDDERSAVLVES